MPESRALSTSAQSRGREDDPEYAHSARQVPGYVEVTMGAVALGRYTKSLVLWEEFHAGRTYGYRGRTAAAVRAHRPNRLPRRRPNVCGACRLCLRRRFAHRAFRRWSEASDVAEESGRLRRDRARRRSGELAQRGRVGPL